MLSLATNPKSVTVGKFKLTEFVPSYSLPLAVISEIVIGFGSITRFALVILGVL